MVNNLQSERMKIYSNLSELGYQLMPDGSMGKETTGICQECLDKNLESEENELHTCYDCKCEFKLKDGGTLWKDYDFYPAQGDEPTPVCKPCRTLPAHRDRVAKDRADYEAEQDSYDD